MVSFVSLFILGVVIGSFLNVLIYRIPQNISILGRSFCPHCKKQIGWSDNIPLLSFIALGGKCRYCHSPISWQYPIVELITGLLFALTFIELRIMDFVTLGYYLVILSSLVAIFFTDLKYGIIPDKIVFPLIGISLLYLFVINNALFVIHLLSALGASVFFLLLILATKGRGMGFGDVKLAFLMGLFLGWPNVMFAIYGAFFIGAGASVLLVLAKKKKMSATIPFGPFLVVGTLLALFFGTKIAFYFPFFS